LILFAASSSVSSGEAASMTPGLAASVLASFGLCVHYILRLKATTPNAPPKEAVALAFALAFFGFSTAFQSLFAAGIIQLPEFPSPDSGLPSSFPDIRGEGSLGGIEDNAAATVAISASADPLS